MFKVVPFVRLSSSDIELLEFLLVEGIGEVKEEASGARESWPVLFPFSIHEHWVKRFLPELRVALFNELQRTLWSNVVGITCPIIFPMEHAIAESTRFFATLMAGMQADGTLRLVDAEPDMVQTASFADPQETNVTRIVRDAWNHSVWMPIQTVNA